MKKLGFTLAEVLLAVAILGVVAAVTIGVLRNVIPEDYTYTSKKASVTLSEGVKTILEDDKKYPSKEFKNGEKFCEDYADLFKMGANVDCTLNEPVENIENAAANGLSKDSDLYNRANIKATNGEVWWGVSQNFEGDEPIKILTDVNGPNKGNNKLGEDIVALDLYKNGKIGVHEIANTSRTPDKDGALGICTPITTVVSRENISDKAENETANVAHRLCYQERIRCIKDGETTETTRPEVCIECPDVEDRKVLIGINKAISLDPISNMATTYRAGIEYKRLCPASLTDGTINIGEFKYEDGSSVGTITLNETLNTIGASKEGEKEKHTGGYYGKAHITKADNCTIRQRAVLINKHVYEKGLAVSEEISGMSTADMLLWNDKKSSNTISGSLRIGAGNDCSTIDSAIYRKDGRGASVRMTDPTSLKLFLTNAGSNKDYINLGCGYLNQCAQIERDCGGTAFYKYKEFDMPYVFGSRNDGVTTCQKCEFPTRNILKVTMTDPKNADYSCRTANTYGDCPNDWTDTKYKMQCSQARRNCPPLTAGGTSYNFSSNFPGGSKGGDGNMNLGSEPYDRDGGKKGCKACTLKEEYFLKENKDAKTAVKNNDKTGNGYKFKYMTACTQISRECEDTTFNQGFKSDKSKNLLGCSACYSEHVLQDIKTAKCERTRTCDAADKWGTGKGQEEYNKYTQFNSGKVKYDCACELLSSSELSSSTENRYPTNFQYCDKDHSKGACPSGTRDGNPTYKYFTIKVSSSHIQQAKEKMYKFVWDKDVSNNMVDKEQRLEYKDNYEPVRGNWSSLPQKEEELTPYFIFQGCDAGTNMNCELVSYDQKKQEFRVKVSGQETCHEKCSDNGTSCGRSEGGFCDSCCKWETYPCPTESNPGKTCKACAKYKNNSRCMVYKFKNDKISKVTVKYRYPSPLCSNKLDTLPKQPEPLDRCGKCSVVETCNSAENYKQTVCENTDCNGPKSVICCPAQPQSDNVSTPGVTYAVANCGGINTDGSTAGDVNAGECLSLRSPLMAFKTFNKKIPVIGSKESGSVVYSDAKITLTVVGINGYKIPAKITIKAGNKTFYDKVPVYSDGRKTYKLKGFTGGKITIGLQAGNACGEGMNANGLCIGRQISPGEEACKLIQGRYYDAGGSCGCDGAGLTCPDGSTPGIVNPYDGWKIKDVNFSATKESGYQSCKY